MTRTKKDPIYFGVHHIFSVRPMVPLPLRNSDEPEGPYKAWVFREPDSKQRATQWMVDVTRRVIDNPCSEIYRCITYPTQREAKAEAQRLAAEEKTIALLKGE